MRCSFFMPENCLKLARNMHVYFIVNVNDVFNALGGKPVQSPMMNMLNNFYEFRKNFKGNPQQEVQKLIQSGRISPQQYQQIQAMAQQLQPYIK